MSYATENIRNIAITGHSGSGKTTLVEALLQGAGAINQKGSVARGTTVCDFDPQEKTHQHSLDSAIASLDYQGSHVNLIDTPGYPDFIGRALSVLPAVETCAVVVNAQAGVEMVTGRLMEAAGERGLDRLLIVNKIDADGVDLETVLQQLREVYGSECLPLNLPAASGTEVVDCFFQSEGRETDFLSVAEAHVNIVDQVVELDEELMEQYLEQGEDVKPEQLHEPFEQALREGHFIPVCFVSAETGAGVPQLLQILARLMPNPGEGNPPPVLRGEGDAAEQIEIRPDPGGHVIAHVFKVNIDPFVGKLGVFRIHQGTVTKDSQLYIGDARKPFKVGHLLKVQGKEHNEINRGVPGDICGVAKIDEIHFNALLHDSHDEDQVYLQSIDIPAPMYGLAIQAKSRGDEQKISDALHKLEAEDQSFLVEHNATTNETVIRGLGEFHLRIMLEKLKDRHNVEVSTRPPKIAYKETVTANAEGHHRHKKQTGGAGQFGEVFLRIEPMSRGSGFEFVDAVVGGVIPKPLIPAVEKGIKQALGSGALSGNPMQDIRVTVYDGKHHPVDSKEVAFIAAGKKAFLDAFHKARPVVLEPIVDINVTAPSGAMGDINADISGKRGRISNTLALAGGMSTITASVPLGELDNYQSQLKSMTGGVGSYSLSFSHYDPVPAKTQKELIAAYKPKEEED
ncbi:MAG: elongation factor G [Gammaproteobacteria bacterium]|nr:elongation factor G [Gammaproteobacteria bacterium]MDE0286006.1 elongation factor G [Gammaproteobacteria bacterium]MDE0512283.1 elongation factor G [Gammaproteobacteria bacterium]